MVIATWLMLAVQAAPPTLGAPTLAPPTPPPPLASLSQGRRGAEFVNRAEVINPANYPFNAKGRGDEGRVQYRVAIDAAGVVTGCTIVTPAAAATLNQPTCDLILAKARFTPARDLRGRAIASTYTRAVNWMLAKGPPLAVADGHERVVLTFEGSGGVSGGGSGEEAGDGPMKPTCTIEATEGVESDPRLCGVVLASAMVRDMANARASVIKAQMARFAAVSEQSNFAGPDALQRALAVGKRGGEDLNDRTILRLTIDPAGAIKHCAVIEQGRQSGSSTDGEPGFVPTCASMASFKYEPDETAEERTLWMVSAAYYRER